MEKNGHLQTALKSLIGVDRREGAAQPESPLL